MTFLRFGQYLVSVRTPSEQVETWRRIIDINWWSIFEPAVSALAACGDFHRAGTKEALRRLIEAVGVIEDADLGKHINVGAELLPKLASDRKRERGVLYAAGDGGVACESNDSAIRQTRVGVGAGQTFCVGRLSRI